jgi:hypothetical protein
VVDDATGLFECAFDILVLPAQLVQYLEVAQFPATAAFLPSLHKIGPLQLIPQFVCLLPENIALFSIRVDLFADVLSVQFAIAEECFLYLFNGFVEFSEFWFDGVQFLEGAGLGCGVEFAV